MPQVLAVDQARHWMLTGDFGPFTEVVPTVEWFDGVGRSEEFHRCGSPKVGMYCFGNQERR
jgi:hypothetical protein